MQMETSLEVSVLYPMSDRPLRSVNTEEEVHTHSLTHSGIITQWFFRFLRRLGYVVLVRHWPEADSPFTGAWHAHEYEGG